MALNRLLREAARQAALARGLPEDAVRLDLAADLPVLDVDAAMIDEALVNLLQNAFEAGAAAEPPELASRYETAGGEGTIVVEVRDRGRGIPPDQLDEVLRPFVTTKPTGTGLGLVVVTRAAEQHRARFQLAPREGGGTVAAIRFPVRRTAAAASRRAGGRVTANGAGLVLLVDDDASTRKVAKANLALEGFEVIVASSGAEALARLAESDPLAMVSDLKMPDMDGIALMEKVHAIRPSLPVVLVTAHATVETAVQAMRKGALHYLDEAHPLRRAGARARHAVAHERQRRDVARLTGELERAAGFEEMVGSSPPMREVFSMVEQVAPADATVLLRGETGTGKELVARAIHRRSPRGERPFVAVNCTAIPQDLMETEFFGHERGAFTGAAARRIGRFEQADGWTLFLDEVGDLDLAIQAKLLRVLQEQEITRVGGQDADPRSTSGSSPRRTATSRRSSSEGRFRDDLYYRLERHPHPAAAAARAARGPPRLLEHFLGSFAARYGRPAPHPAAGPARRGARLPVAGERPRAAEPVRARGADGVGGGRAHPRRRARADARAARPSSSTSRSRCSRRGRSSSSASSAST